MADLSRFSKDCLKSPFAARVLCDEASSLVSAYLSLLLEHLREERTNSSTLTTLDDLRAVIKNVESEMALETVQVVIYHERLRHAQRAIKRLESKKKQLLVKADEIVLKESRRPSLPIEIVANILSLAHDAHAEENKRIGGHKADKKSNVLEMALSLDLADPWRRAILSSLTITVDLGEETDNYRDFENNGLSKLSLSYGMKGSIGTPTLDPLKLQSHQCSEFKVSLDSRIGSLQPFMGLLPSFRSLEVICDSHGNSRDFFDMIEKLKDISATNIRHAAFSLPMLPNMLGRSLCAGVVSLFIHIPPQPCHVNLVEHLRHISQLHALTQLTIASLSFENVRLPHNYHSLIADGDKIDAASQLVPYSLRDLNFTGFDTTFISSALSYFGSRKIQTISINRVLDYKRVMYAVKAINKWCPSLERLECDLLFRYTSSIEADVGWNSLSSPKHGWTLKTSSR
ncbi:hypothetical protein DFH11DRAFT_1879541 [Phellopilus nigrolimitatus]|nr:hypothetical protein DFH11DRAFT_1879541 [Phellopilus nigrolimitatus]